MGDFLSDVSGDELNQILQIAAFAGVIFGVIISFRGYRMFRALILLTGFAIGMGIPAAAAYAEDGPEGLIGGLIVGIFTGFLGAAIVFALYRLAVVVGGGALGALAGYAVATEVMNISANNNDELMPIILVGGAIGAILLTRFEMPIIKLLTSYGGAAVTVISGWLLANESVFMLQSPLKIPEQLPEGEVPSLLLIIFVIGTIGAAIQLSQQEADKSKQAQAARQRQLQQQQRQAQQPAARGDALPAPVANAPGVQMREFDLGGDTLMIRDPVESLPDIPDNPVEQPDSGEPVPLDIGSADVFGQATERASLQAQTRWIVIGLLLMWGAAVAITGGSLAPDQTPALIAISVLWIGMLTIRWMQYNAVYNIREADDIMSLNTDTTLANLVE